MLTENDPEILFHRTLTSGKTKYKDRGKLALHWLPREMEDICTQLRDHINTLHASIQVQFTTPHGTEPKLYFNFLDDSEANALAFTDGSWSFIGLTGGFASQTMLQLQQLIGCSSFPKWLAIGPEHYQAEPSALLVSLFRLVLSFVWAHELGHHICGHVPLKVDAQHFRAEATACSESGSLRRQAEELDADKHGVETLLNQLKRDPDAFFEGSMRGLAAASRNRDLQLRCLLAAVTVFLLSSRQCRFSAATISGLTHPPRLIRIDYIDGVMRDWLQKESLVSVPTKDDFYSLVDCIETPTTDNTAAFDTEQQVRALSDDEWRKYLSDLTVVRKGLREEDGPFEWKRR